MKCKFYSIIKREREREGGEGGKREKICNNGVKVFRVDTSDFARVK